MTVKYLNIHKYASYIFVDATLFLVLTSIISRTGIGITKDTSSNFTGITYYKV